jgi:hypothetical protein
VSTLFGLMALEPGSSAPYAPPKHVLGVLGRYRHKGLATPFSKELFERLGMPDAYANRTLRAFRLLDLVTDEGEPTEALRALRLAREEEYQSRLEQVVRTAYQPVFEVTDPATDGEQAVLDAFRHFEPAAQRHRMVTLFLALCEEAGVIAPGQGPKKRGRATATNGGSIAPRAKGKVRAEREGKLHQQQPPPPLPGGDDPARDPAIVGIMARLPRSLRWSDHDRAKWFRALEGAVDLLIEVENAGGADGGA